MPPCATVHRARARAPCPVPGTATRLSTGAQQCIHFHSYCVPFNNVKYRSTAVVYPYLLLNSASYRGYSTVYTVALRLSILRFVCFFVVVVLFAFFSPPSVDTGTVDIASELKLRVGVVVSVLSTGTHCGRGSFSYPSASTFSRTPNAFSISDANAITKSPDQVKTFNTAEHTPQSIMALTSIRSTACFMVNGVCTRSFNNVILVSVLFLVAASQGRASILQERGLKPTALSLTETSSSEVGAPPIEGLLSSSSSLKQRNLRPLPPGTPCDEHGNQGKTLFSSRMKRSLDFQLCKRAKGDEYCELCKCTWTYYWEAASLCFRLDPEYKARVFAEKQQWEDDSLLYCNRQAMEFSLDENSPDFCGNFAIRGTAPGFYSVLIMFITFSLTVLQLNLNI